MSHGPSKLSVTPAGIQPTGADGTAPPVASVDANPAGAGWAAAGGPVRGAGAEPIVLVAHGSRDPAAARSTLALRDAVQAARPGGEVLATFLDFEGPRPAATLVELGGPAVVIPLLLTEAYHGRVDVPGEVARAREAGAEGARLATVLGPVGGRDGDAEVLALLVAALASRLPEVGLDGVVVAGAGSRHLAALATVDWVAEALGTALGVPALAGYASGAGRSVTSAIATLRGAGATRIGMATYFLAPGRLYDRAVEQARGAGAVAVAPPLDAAAQVVEAVLHRVAAAG